MELVNKYLEKFKDNKYSKIINYLITIISLYYLFIKFRNIEITIFQDLNPLLSVLYGLLVFLSLLLQSLAWSYLFKEGNKNHYSKVWINSNIGKYIPIKVGVILNRYIKLEEDSLKNITKNYILEQSLILGTSLFAACLFLFIESLFILFTIFILLLLTTRGLRGLSSNLKKALYIYYTSTCLNIIFLALLSVEIFGIKDLELVSIYIFSTIIGMFIFTSPAGIGVREAVFLYFTDGTIVTNNVLTFLFITRAMYILCDILILGYGTLFLNDEKKSNN